VRSAHELSPPDGGRPEHKGAGAARFEVTIANQVLKELAYHSVRTGICVAVLSYGPDAGSYLKI
jgi:hypothetical protein